jgi:hypothetical protein
MTAEREEILDRLYQSYIMGGDVFTYNFNTANPKTLEYLQNMLKDLEKEEYFTIKFMNEKRARLQILDKGIDFGNRG